MNRAIKESCVLVTGAASGIGAHVARLSLNGGSCVIAIDVQSVSLENTTGKLRAFSTDVRDEGGIIAALESAGERSLTSIVLAAAVGPCGKDPLVTLAVNLESPVWLLQRIEKWMCPGGIVVLLGSSAGLRFKASNSMREYAESLACGRVDESLRMLVVQECFDDSYGAAKWGLLYAMNRLKKRLRRHRIGVVYFVPGPTDTQMASEMRRNDPVRWASVIAGLGDGKLQAPSDVAASILDFVKADSMQLTGCIIHAGSKTNERWYVEGHCAQCVV